MIDIHCHILPYMDDGARHFADSLMMAKQAEKEGIHTIIATPHHKNGRYFNPKKVIIEKVKELNEYLASEQVNVKVLPGQEVRVYGELIQDYEAKEIITVGDCSNYLLIELPNNQVPHFIDQLCYDIQMRGLVPVIVHPERNTELLDRPEKVYRLVKNGVLTQVTAASLVGFFGKKIQKFTFDLIDSNLTHFIASDAHNVTNRTFKMAEAFEVLENRYGIDYVYMFMDNAELMLEGENIYRDIPQQVKRKKIFDLF